MHTYNMCASRTKSAYFWGAAFISAVSALEAMAPSTADSSLRPSACCAATSAATSTSGLRNCSIAVQGGVPLPTPCTPSESTEPVQSGDVLSLYACHHTHTHTQNRWRRERERERERMCLSQHSHTHQHLLLSVFGCVCTECADKARACTRTSNIYTSECGYTYVYI